MQSHAIITVIVQTADLTLAMEVMEPSTDIFKTSELGLRCCYGLKLKHLYPTTPNLDSHFEPLMRQHLLDARPLLSFVVEQTVQDIR
jgi:hypothetical protein